jgi:hypothetical protein
LSFQRRYFSQCVFSHFHPSLPLLLPRVTHFLLTYQQTHTLTFFSFVFAELR